MDPFVKTGVPLIAGYTLDLLLGDPVWLPHPIVGFGMLIARGERRLNRGSAGGRFLRGALLATGLIVGVYVAAFVVQRWAFRLHPAAGLACATIGVFYALANRTLITEGRGVFRALGEGIEAGRHRLARIVGRDTARLEAHEVRTAVFETMAENLSDGVVAPLFFYALGGLPAMLAYKMINTLDSMIAHRDARYEWFGKAAARIDDAANFIPARLTALLLVAVAGSRRGWGFVRRYGRSHASPNSGYPEAALAGILDLRFGGPHTYDGERIDQPWIGENARPIAPSEIETVVRLNHAVCLLAVFLTAVVAWFFTRYRVLPWAN